MDQIYILRDETEWHGPFEDIEQLRACYKGAQTSENMSEHSENESDKLIGIHFDQSKWESKGYIYIRTEVMFPKLNLTDRLRILIGMCPSKFIQMLRIQACRVNAENKDVACQKGFKSMPLDKVFEADKWNHNAFSLAEKEWVV